LTKLFFRYIIKALKKGIRKGKDNKKLSAKGIPMKTTNDTQNNGSFWPAVNAAKEITERRPDKDQPKEYETLVTAMRKLDSGSQQAVVWQIINEVLGGKTNTKIQAAFAVARTVRPQMTHLVHNTAVVKQLVKDFEADEQLPELIKLGLAEIRTDGSKVRVVYKIGFDALKEAARTLKGNGEAERANVVDMHLRRLKEFQLLRQAEQAARSAEAAGPEEAETVSVDADAEDEPDLVVGDTVPKDKAHEDKPPPRKRRKKKPEAV